MNCTLLASQHENGSVLASLDATLLNDINHYLRDLSERDEIVFRSRFGLGNDYLTLERTGERLAEYNRDGSDMTRERVRQIQADLINQWHNASTIDPETLWEHVTQFYDLINGDFLPKVAGLFGEMTSFNRFLAAVCKRSLKEVNVVYSDNIKPVVLDEFWVNSSPSPVMLSEITDYLTRQLGMDIIPARNMIFHFIEQGHIALHDRVALEVLSPQKLSKSVALAHASLAFPDGAPWLELQSYVNKHNYCHLHVTELRLEFAIGTAVDNGWLYQSNRGEYAPISLLAEKLEGTQITQILHALKTLLNNRESDDSVALAQLFNRNKGLFFDLGYYTVRYIAKQYGVLEGIYFSGLSSSDMVSLDSEVGIRSKRDIIVEEFTDGREFTLEEVSLLLRSGSRRHAIYLTDNLIKEGRVVKISKDNYSVAKVANIGVKVSALMTHVHTLLLKNDGQKFLYKDIYTHLQQDKEGKSLLQALQSVNHLSSIIRASYGQYKGDWTFSGSYVQLNAK